MRRDPIERFRTQRNAFTDRSFVSPVRGAELADLTLRSYQALAWTFLRQTLVPTLFCLAASLFFIHFLSDLFSTKAHNQHQEVLEVGLKLALAFGVAWPIFLVGLSWLTSIVTCIGSDWMLGRVPDGKAAQSRAIRSLPKLIGATFYESFLGLSGVIVSLILLFISQLLPSDSSDSASAVATIGVFGIVVGFLVAIFVYIIHCLVPAIVVTEGLSPRAAAKRSRALMSTTDAYRGNPAQTAILQIGGACLIGLLACLMAWGFFDNLLGVGENLTSLWPGTVVHLLLTAMWSLLPLFLILWLVLPVWSLGTLATCINAKVRTEGYDIDLLAGEVWQRDKRARFEI